MPEAVTASAIPIAGCAGRRLYCSGGATGKGAPT